jgi:undecaprenyl-diphosphatase
MIASMSLLQIIVLALIQGLTEFLPVSSSAHLILGSKAFGWPDQGLVFDVATHLGTLVAVFIYFRRELLEMAGAWLAPVATESDRRHRAMALYLILASIPALLVGALVHDAVELHLRDVRVIAWTTIGFGLLLWIADWRCSRVRDLSQINLPRALVIGLAQAFALIPGASRSGVTITAGRFLGFSPDAAARFSFLLAIPVIGAAGSYGALRVISGDAQIDWGQFVLAMVFSAIAGWVCIAAFLALLKRVGLLPFVLYRLALGLALLWISS